jgi:membrane protein DedA with SNARE-associated domain
MITTFLLTHFSYYILFIWSLFEGEIGLSLAGYMSKEGKFDFFLVLCIAVSGALIGDMALFLIGKFSKNSTQKYLQRYENRLEIIEKWFKHNVVWLILFERFVYGTHIPSLLLIGHSGYSFIKFFLLDIIGVVLWALTFTLLGYYFGESVVTFMLLVQRHLSLLLLLLFFAILLFIQRKKAEKN